MFFFSKKITTRLGYSHNKGRVRDNNEDSLSWDADETPAALEKRGRIYVIADGMGGHVAGELASQMAVETVVGEYQKSVGKDIDILATLQSILLMANAKIYEQGQTSGYSGMGTTVVCAVFKGSALFLAHIGDSRAYLFRRGHLRQLTNDHTLVHELLSQSALTPEQAAKHPQRHVLSRALGYKPEVVPDLQGPLQLEAGDRVLLCTDGISGYLSDEQIADTLQTNLDDPQGCAISLTQSADMVGGKDNATAMVIALDRAR